MNIEKKVLQDVTMIEEMSTEEHSTVERYKMTQIMKNGKPSTREKNTSVYLTGAPVRNAGIKIKKGQIMPFFTDYQFLILF